MGDPSPTRSVSVGSTREGEGRRGEENGGEGRSRTEESGEEVAELVNCDWL